MASFQKRGKTWQYTVSRMVNGVPDPIRKGGYATKKEAQIAAGEIEEKLRKGLTPNLKPVVFTEYFEEWMGTYKAHIAENTRARYRDTLRIIKEFFPGVYIQDMTKKMYQEFLNRHAETHSTASLQKLNEHIRACAREAIDEGLIYVDFTRRAIISGKIAAKRPEEKHLNYFDSKRLMKALEKPKTDNDYLILLGLTSGMRFAEMVGLTHSDFNFKAGTITIDKTWGYYKTMHEGAGATKTETSNRVVKMDSKTMEIFKAWFKIKPQNIHNLVFFSPSSKYKVLSNGGSNKALELRLEALNIEPISIHGLRHTHASILLYRGISIYYVSERLGHKKIEITLKHYAHIVKELREKDEKSTLKTMEEMMA